MATEYGSVALWQNPVVTGNPRLELLGRHIGSVTSLAFSADGSLLASGGSDRNVLLWDVPTHEQLGAAFTGHAGTVRGLSFSPDGRMLASGGEDSNLLLWDLDVHSWERRVCGIVGRSLTKAEWETFTTDRSYRPTCP
jgi:WD40 repeat protein